MVGTLAKYHVTATFTLTGDFVRDFPAQAKAIAAAGHRIGDHSVSHPYNAHAISVVNSTGFVPVGWTVDTLSWEGTSGGITTQTVLNRVLGSLRPGEIVLMHCARTRTIIPPWTQPRCPR
jgi:peptidoglycan/xylan/chitin deacetylase (PgdA/CDA1 family)